MKNLLQAFQQPRGFYLLFSIEVWERFGFYGTQALLVLYLVQHRGYSDVDANNLFASFSALIWMLPFAGGFIGDRILGTKRTMVLGAIVLALGYLTMAVAGTSNLHIALAMIVIGNGLFKANPSSILSKLYEQGDARTDSGFTLYYMAINIGGLASMSLNPVIASHFGWHTAFFISFSGMVLTLCNYGAMRHRIESVGSEPDFIGINISRLLLVIAGVITAVALTRLLLIHDSLTQYLLYTCGFGILVVYLYEIKNAESYERPTMVLALILIIQAIIFYVLYQQTPTSLTLFALRNVDHQLLGLHIEPAAFQALNTFWVMTLSPLLAAFYHKLEDKQVDFTIPAKFACGTLIAGLAFLALSFATDHFAIHGIVSAWWLVLAYALDSTGELLIAALGLAMISRYIPQRLMGFAMGAWFLASAIGTLLAGKIANLAAVPKDIVDPVQSLPLYHALFNKLGLVTIGISVVMFVLLPLLHRLHNKQPSNPETTILDHDVAAETA